mmetsp:Transcript_968/g.3879  ORF Transcript_968/g.3879 Transcript_968/m.3879 type:complete len:230 (-) Transcript_968:112-801(-)
MATAEGLTAIAPASTSTRPRTTLAPRCRLGWSPRRPFTRRTAGPTALCPNSGSEPAQLRRSWSKSAGSSPLPSTAACPRRPPRPHQPPRLRRPRRSSPVHWRRLSARGNDLTHARTQKWVSMFAIGRVPSAELPHLRMQANACSSSSARRCRSCQEASTMPPNIASVGPRDVSRATREHPWRSSSSRTHTRISRCRPVRLFKMSPAELMTACSGCSCCTSPRVQEVSIS